MPFAPDTAGTLPSKLNLAEAMRIMDVASALRRESETVEREFDHDQLRARLREKLARTAELTGETLTPEQLEAAIDWYFDNLHEFKPPRPGLATALAHAYVRRGVIAAWLLGIAMAVLVGCFLMTSSYSPISTAGRRARQQAQAAAAARQREQASAALAATFAREADTILALTSDDQVMQTIEGWKKQMQILQRQHELEGMQSIEKEIVGLRDQLDDEYTVFVVAGENNRSAFERFYEDEQGKRLSGYYVVVEARDGQGKVLPRRIRNDETDATEQVTQWAERVPDEVYLRLKADKTEDGILNETRFAVKQAGELEEQVVMPDAAGQPLKRDAQITKW